MEPPKKTSREATPPRAGAKLRRKLNKDSPRKDNKNSQLFTGDIRDNQVEGCRMLLSKSWGIWTTQENCLSAPPLLQNHQKNSNN